MRTKIKENVSSVSRHVGYEHTWIEGIVALSWGNYAAASGDHLSVLLIALLAVEVHD